MRLARANSEVQAAKDQVQPIIAKAMQARAAGLAAAQSESTPADGKNQQSSRERQRRSRRMAPPPAPRSGTQAGKGPEGEQSPQPAARAGDRGALSPAQGRARSPLGRRSGQDTGPHRSRRRRCAACQRLGRSLLGHLDAQQKIRLAHALRRDAGGPETDRRERAAEAQSARHLPAAGDAGVSQAGVPADPHRPGRPPRGDPNPADGHGPPAHQMPAGRVQIHDHRSRRPGPEFRRVHAPGRSR